ncbi:MAG: hypothetical protein H6715_03850 [Myxococcales bacterium]|nr:hypothetical protein [Myxococcales bacterium]MCB9708664.1 hypothetical protein [Myxococcales bacterium]
MTIVLDGDIQEYFRLCVGSALKRQRVTAHERTEFYLVNLLSEHAIGSPRADYDRSLVDLLSDAMAAEGAEQLRRFRDMGDGALYRTGFFSEHLIQKGIGREYVMAMGGRAYGAARHAAKQCYRSADSDFADVFGDLASRFGEFVRVLDDVKERTELRTPQDIIKLYERWRITQSPILEQRLRQHGVFPLGESNKTTH